MSSTLSPAAAARRILILEDEPDIAALLELHLQELPAEVVWSADGRDGLHQALHHGPWDLLVLDLRLPGLSGLEVCRELRQRDQQLPVLMLTARGTELDRVLGLELGADDYLTKPFSVLELQARIRALWRRAGRLPPEEVTPVTADCEALRQGALRIDRRERRAWLGQREVALTPREFDLIWHFARQPGKAFSRDELLNAVWGLGHDGYEHTVNTHINRLRSKLGEGYIHTVWGVGYRFEVVS
jgi:DNA-binding response OmpR family regulator